MISECDCGRPVSWAGCGTQDAERNGCLFLHINPHRRPLRKLRIPPCIPSAPSNIAPSVLPSQMAHSSSQYHKYIDGKFNYQAGCPRRRVNLENHDWAKPRWLPRATSLTGESVAVSPYFCFNAFHYSPCRLTPQWTIMQR